MCRPESRPPRATRPLRAILHLALAIGACRASAPATAPDGASAQAVEYALRVLEGGTLPIVLRASASGPAIEVLSGSLRFTNFSAGRGPVVQRGVRRESRPGRPPVETASEVGGTFERHGDTVFVARDNGSSETYLLLDAGRRLRTLVATGPCAAPAGGSCTGEVRLNVFERVP